MTRNINLLKEKINVVEDIIEQIDQDILNPNVLTSMLLNKIIATCNNITNSDF